MLWSCVFVLLNTRIFRMGWACAIFKNPGLVDRALKRCVATLRAPLQKCKSKEGFRSGGGAWWLSRKHNHALLFSRFYINLVANVQQHNCDWLFFDRAEALLTCVLGQTFRCVSLWFASWFVCSRFLMVSGSDIGVVSGGCFLVELGRLVQSLSSFRASPLMHFRACHSARLDLGLPESAGGCYVEVRCSIYITYIYI